jgi:Mg/Co/Ni transporter MgtE
MTTLSHALTTWLAAGDTASMREAVRTMHPADIANELGGLPPQDAARVLTALPPDRQGTVFGTHPSRSPWRNPCRAPNSPGSSPR